MDALDVGILREMTRERVLVIGSLDPRISAGAIARRLRVDPTTVRDRLRAWERSGFVTGYHVLPSLHLFGAGVAATGVRVRDVRDKPRLLRDLALVDGLIGALDFVGEWIGLALVDETRAALERRERLLARLPGVAEVMPSIPTPQPPVGLTPSPLDWRVLAALRRYPRATLAEAAKEVGVSVRTLTRHYERLVQSRAVWFVPELDFTRYTGATLARFTLYSDVDVDLGALERRLGEVCPAILGVHAQAPREARDQPLIVEALLHLDSAAGVEDAHVAALGVPGVREIEILFPRRLSIMTQWIDERMAEEMKRSDVR